MEKEFKKIKKILTRLHDLQAGQIDSFDKETLPDLEKQSADRSIEMAELVKRVGQVVKMAEAQNTTDTESMMLILNDRVTTLLEQNKTLETKVRGLKDRIKINMEQISKGKKVIGSYRSSAAVSKSPRVLSITN